MSFSQFRLRGSFVYLPQTRLLLRQLPFPNPSKYYLSPKHFLPVLFYYYLHSHRMWCQGILSCVQHVKRWFQNLSGNLPVFNVIYFSLCSYCFQPHSIVRPMNFLGPELVSFPALSFDPSLECFRPLPPATRLHLVPYFESSC